MLSCAWTFTEQVRCTRIHRSVRRCFTNDTRELVGGGVCSERRRRHGHSGLPQAVHVLLRCPSSPSIIGLESPLRIKSKVCWSCVDSSGLKCTAQKKLEMVPRRTCAFSVRVRTCCKGKRLRDMKKQGAKPHFGLLLLRSFFHFPASDEWLSSLRLLWTTSPWLKPSLLILGKFVPP